MAHLRSYRFVAEVTFNCTQVALLFLFIMIPSISGCIDQIDRYQASSSLNRLYTHSLIIVFVTSVKGVFRTQSNIYDGAFLQK